MFADAERQGDAQYGLKIEKPNRANRFSEKEALRVLLLIVSIAACALLIQQSIYYDRAQRYETAVSAVSVSAENSVAESIAAEEAENAPVNVNTADLQELCRLKGIGESKAQAIIDYRMNNGLFTYKEELMQVKGIGEKLYASIAEQIVLSDEELTTE